MSSNYQNSLLSEYEEEEEEYIDSHEQDRQTLIRQIDDFYISSLEQARQKLITQRDRLHRKCEDLKKDLEDNEQAVNDYETERDSLLKVCSDDAMVTGDFFHRMKAYEYREAQFNGELKGLIQASKSLTEQIKLQQKRNQRLQKKLDSQLANLPDGALIPDFYGEEEDSQSYEIQRAIRLRRLEGSQSLKALQAELDQLEDETVKMKNECENLRDIIRDKSARLQTIPSETIDKLADQRHEIENEIELKKKQLKQLLIDEKKLNATKNNDNEKERLKAEKMENSDPWESERKGLVDAIAHAHAEFQDLCNQLNIDPDNLPEQRSAYGDKRPPSQLSINESKRSRAPSSLSESRRNARRRLRDDESDARSRISQKSCFGSEKVRYTQKLLRNALKKELDSLEDDNNPINIAIQIEERYRNELDDQLENIEMAIEQINSFEKETFENSSDVDQDNIMWQQRMDVLQNEYLELRAELRDSKV